MQEMRLRRQHNEAENLRVSQRRVFVPVRAVNVSHAGDLAVASTSVQPPASGLPVAGTNLASGFAAASTKPPDPWNADSVPAPAPPPASGRGRARTGWCTRGTVKTA